MKTALIAAASLTLLTVTSVQAQAPSRRAKVRTQETTFVAPRNQRANAAVTTPAPAPDGVVPRAIRSGNPLQMINPFAPAEYGGGQDVVRHEDGDPYQNMRGIKLFAVAF